jgi:hypothetical protein
MGGGDVGGMSDFTSELSFAGSGSRLVAVASRSSQRLFSQGWLSALDLPATGYYMVAAEELMWHKQEP